MTNTRGRLHENEVLAAMIPVGRTPNVTARALQDLERALATGEPEGYVRVFVDEGAAMATLLRRAHSRGVAPEYASRLLEAFSNRASQAHPSKISRSAAETTCPLPHATVSHQWPFEKSARMLA